MTGRQITGVILGLGLLCAPSSAAAQTAVSGSIAGVVKDTTGAVLPGVTVEAASPALIEKVRTAVTDDQGQYKILDLRPGTYTVTFTLTGFATVKREGIQLTTGFTAPANAEMKVGSLQETVTVTGASPVVDVQNVRTQAVLSQEVLDTVPTGKTIQGFAAMILGASGAGTDVGGNKSEQPAGFGIHGTKGADSRLAQDGMILSTMEVNGAVGGRLGGSNQVGVQETVIQTGNMSAESETGGPQINLVPKDGGNTFTFYGLAAYSNQHLQNSNINDDLRARGLTQVPKAKLVYDDGVGVGGPIRKDKLWFYTAHRWWGSQEYQPNIWLNLTQHTPVYTPDLAHPGYIKFFQRDNNGRVTWQATQRNKLTFSVNLQKNCNCNYPVSATRALDASTDQRFGSGGHPYVQAQGTWNNPMTNRLLFEVGATYVGLSQLVPPPEGSGVLDSDIPMVELSTGLRYNAKMETFTLANEYSDPKNPNGYLSIQTNTRAAVSYITGSHAFKTGIMTLVGKRDFTLVHKGGAVRYEFRFGVPAQLSQSASPNGNEQHVTNFGWYGQDQWTVKHLTLNLGLRFDYLNEYVAAQHLEAGPFVPARDFPRVDGVPHWKDINPRLGASYDLFGNGKTAIKASLGRYVAIETSNTAISNSPSNSIVGIATRTWNDVNGNFTPDCDLKTVTANGECGAMNNSRFGTVVIASRYEDNVLHGWSARGFNWQQALSIQHELKPGMAVNVGYYRTWYGNFTTSDNSLVGPTDFDEYCVTAPNDPRLGANSGQKLCGLYDVKPAKFGQVDTVISQSSKFGKRDEIFNGLDFGVNSRFGKGGLLNGGVSFGKTVTDTCDQNIDSPTRPGFCHVSPPWGAGSQVKVSGVYPLPFGTQASAVYQNTAGIPISANYVVTNALIAPSLGRNLAACGTATTCTATVSIPLIPTNTEFQERLSQLDLRFTKIIRFGHARVQGMFDIYNVTNSATVLGVVTTYPTNFLNPSSILSPRLFKFGAQIDF